MISYYSNKVHVYTVHVPCTALLFYMFLLLIYTNFDAPSLLNAYTASVMTSSPEVLMSKLLSDQLSKLIYAFVHTRDNRVYGIGSGGT